MENPIPSKVVKVKNKAPAAVQITAEQLIREAKERELEVLPPPPKQKISDAAELDEYRLRKRKEFEDELRRNKNNVSKWLKYAKWEEDQGCMDRARSIFERALDTTGSTNITIWIRYLDMEMVNTQIKHARTLFDRATYILPRINQFWYKYVHFEETLGNIPACRHIFEKWIRYLPGEQEWQTYINFELRYKEVERAREIYSKYVMLHPEVKTWVKFARFEERNSSAENARQVFELALEFFDEKELDETLYIEFAQFEERQHEYDRVKLIYEYALKKLPKNKALMLYENYSDFQKKHGAPKDVDYFVTQKRKLIYDDLLQKCPRDYDTWFDYVKLAEDEMELDEIRLVYERAIACKPESYTNKEEWRRYIYLWIFYALFEELDAGDQERALKIYKLCIDEIIPHEEFTFAKIWINAARLLIRMNRLNEACELLDKSLDLCPKKKIFNEYIEIEVRLRNFDNCRKLYQKILQRAPDDSSIWIAFAEVEAFINQIARARAIYKAAINRDEMDSPELVWKACIDFEIEQMKKILNTKFMIDVEDNITNSNTFDATIKEYLRVEQLYDDLLEKTNHVKVWLAYARLYTELVEFYNNINNNKSELITKLKLDAQQKARKVFELADRRLKDEEPQSRIVLLETWQQFEESLPDDKLDIASRMPTKVLKRKRIDDEGDDWEEYYEYVFPDVKKQKTAFIERVKQWKAAKQQATESK